MKLAGLFALFSTMLLPVAAAAPPKAAPRLYRVAGRPVPVSCLEALAGMDGDAQKQPIDLRRCGDPKRKPKVQADGSVGYDIPDGGYFYYAYLGQSGGVDILSLQSSGGGSGHFTALVGVKPGGHVLRWVRDYAGGDRCNGGISNAQVAKGRLTFDQAITPYDLIDLAHPKVKLQAYKDLEASAASCIGVVHMAGDGKQWTGVTLTETDWSDRQDWTDGYRYQACFNALYRETVAAGHTELDRRGVAAFADRFARRCLRA